MIIVLLGRLTQLFVMRKLLTGLFLLFTFVIYSQDYEKAYYDLEFEQSSYVTTTNLISVLKVKYPEITSEQWGFIEERIDYTKFKGNVVSFLKGNYNANQLRGLVDEFKSTGIIKVEDHLEDAFYQLGKLNGRELGGQLVNGLKDLIDPFDSVSISSTPKDINNIFKQPSWLPNSNRYYPYSKLIDDKSFFNFNQNDPRYDQRICYAFFYGTASEDGKLVPFNSFIVINKENLSKYGKNTDFYYRTFANLKYPSAKTWVDKKLNYHTLRKNGELARPFIIDEKKFYLADQCEEFDASKIKTTAFTPFGSGWNFRDRHWWGNYWGVKSDSNKKGKYLIVEGIGCLGASVEAENKVITSKPASNSRFGETCKSVSQEATYITVSLSNGLSNRRHYYRSGQECSDCDPKLKKCSRRVGYFEVSDDDSCECKYERVRDTELVADPNYLRFTNMMDRPFIDGNHVSEVKNRLAQSCINFDDDHAYFKSQVFADGISISFPPWARPPFTESNDERIIKFVVDRFNQAYYLSYLSQYERFGQGEERPNSHSWKTRQRIKNLPYRVANREVSFHKLIEFLSNHCSNWYNVTDAELDLLWDPSIVR